MRTSALHAGHPLRRTFPAPFYGDNHLLDLPLELITMDETARENAMKALQRSLDRRDNGGSTGHEAR